MKGIWIFQADGWLEMYDPDGGPLEISYPTGVYGVTTDTRKAMAFQCATDAWAFWHQQSRRTPLRPDGKPNRPLTAYTVDIRDLE